MEVETRHSESAMQPPDSDEEAIDDIEAPSDPDAQAAITDFLDFTEYLPSDVARSFTLVEELEQKHAQAAVTVRQLIASYQEFPLRAPAGVPDTSSIKTSISEKLNLAIRTRALAQSEARRTALNVARHQQKLFQIQAKLDSLYESFPSAQDESAAASHTVSAQATKIPKITIRLGDQGVHKGSRVKRGPRITIPGEVLAPNEFDWDTLESETELSVTPDAESQPQAQRRPSTNGPKKIRLKVAKPQTAADRALKGPRPPRPAGAFGTNVHSSVAGISTSNALAKLQPPPEHAPLGSEHRPWGRLTQFELAKLRKRMKKNAVWQPSTTMINRELTTVGRSLAFYKAAKLEAEATGKPFDYPWCPPETMQPQSEAPQAEEQQSVEGLEEQPIVNKGMKLNEQKKAKKDTMAATAAAEAEEAARKLADAAAQMRGLFPSKPSDKSAPDTIAAPSTKAPAKAAPPRKRKRDSTAETDASKGDMPQLASKNTMTPSTPAPNKSSAPILPSAKRPKVETPVPPPPSGIGARISMPMTTSRTRATAAAELSPHTEPKAPTSATASTTSTEASSATASSNVPIRPPTPRKSSTPILPPTRNRRPGNILPSPSPAPSQPPPTFAQSLSVPRAPSSHGTRSQRSITKTPEPRASSTAPEPPQAPPACAPTPILTLNLSHARRPSSRGGKASSVEPLVTAARERPHRATTAHNTPAPVPEPTSSRPSSRRTKRPPPGKVAAGADGAAAITVGKRSAAPRKKAGGGRKANGSKREGSAAIRASADPEMEFDEDGVPIDPNEPRYCICNRVSFGDMIACENEKTGKCPFEWFHIGCVGIDKNNLPKRTVKWYCPDCREKLGVGGKGEVTARGRKR